MVGRASPTRSITCGSRIIRCVIVVLPLLYEEFLSRFSMAAVLPVGISSSISAAPKRGIPNPQAGKSRLVRPPAPVAQPSHVKTIIKRRFLIARTS